MSEINQQVAEEWIKLNNPIFQIKQFILTEIWDFCEKEFKADFENDYVLGKGSNTGMSDRTELFAEYLSKEILKKCKDNQ